MSALAIGLIIWALLVGGALTGVLLRRLLPEHHLDTHTKDVVRLGCALIATIAGLVLGLLINSGRTSSEIQRDEVRLLTANIMLLDHLLEQYGPETRPVRARLRDAVVVAVNRIWNETGRNERPFVGTPASEATERAIRSLTPANEPQRLIKSQLDETAKAILHARLILYEQSRAGLPAAFLVVLVFWLFILFASFSLFSPLNPTAFASVVVIALSAAAAIFLIVEMSNPFDGLMQIDSEPLRQALPPLAA
jgi:hypothetical protein